VREAEGGVSDFALSSPAEMFASEYFSRQRTVRRALKRWWIDPPVRWCAWLMLNPSDAEAKKDDPTTRRLTYFTRAWGYDGWIAVNIYPFVSSKPAEMWKRADWENNGPDWYARDDMHANLYDIEQAARMAALRVVAFGAQPVEHDRAWLELCLERFGQPFDHAEGKRPATTAYDDENFWCLGTNKTGQPLHPMTRGKMRVPDTTQPQVWRKLRNESD
jgi:hypothetical protein